MIPHSFFFVNTMLRLMMRPIMTERISILQAQFILSSLNLPNDTLLSHLLSHIKSNSDQSRWHRLSKTVLWQHCSRLNHTNKHGWLQDNFSHWHSASHSKLVLLCGPTVSLDPILWISCPRLNVAWFSATWWVNQNHVLNVLITLISRSKTINALICTNDHSYHSLLKVPCLSF